MNSQKPRLLDLFCCAGGATKGYQRAGFYVVGVDIKPQPHYCGDEFHQADALTYPLDGFDAYHASPPCQGYGVTRHIYSCQGKDYPLLVPDVRQRLAATGKPTVIENVPGAPLNYSVMLCGLMFQLKVLRHRIFETNFAIMQPGHPYHRDIEIGKDGFCCVVAHSAVKGNSNYTYPARKAMWEKAMGIDWMLKHELTQAIPPCYTCFIGGYLLSAVLGGEHQQRDSGPGHKCDTCDGRHLSNQTQHTNALVGNESHESLGQSMCKVNASYSLGLTLVPCETDSHNEVYGTNGQ